MAGRVRRKNIRRTIQFSSIQTDPTSHEGEDGGADEA